MLIVGGVLHTVLNADVLTTGQWMPDTSKHQKGGEGFKDIFDEALDRVKKEGDEDDPDTDATSKGGSSANRNNEPGGILP